MKNKKVLIVIGIIILFIVVGLVIFMFSHRGTTEDNKKTLTVVEEITLNDNEKELLSELVNVNDKLLNPTKNKSDEKSKDENTTDYTETIKPTESISLKEFCVKLYEARKTKNDDGKTIYMFDMDTKGNDGKTIRRILVTLNGEITACTFVESDYEEALNQMENTKVENGGIQLGKDFVQVIFEELTKAINEKWEKATKYDNVNYDNILGKI